MNFTKVHITTDEVEAIRTFMEKRWAKELKDLNAQQVVDELTHWILEYGGELQ